MHNVFSRTHVIFSTTYGPLHPGLLCECRGHGTCRVLHQTGALHQTQQSCGLQNPCSLRVG